MGHADQIAQTLSDWPKPDSDLALTVAPDVSVLAAPFVRSPGTSTPRAAPLLAWALWLTRAGVAEWLPRSSDRAARFPKIVESQFALPVRTHVHQA